MMHRMIGRMGTALCLVLLVCGMTACNESTFLGQNLVPGSDHVNSLETDTFTVRTRTVFRPDDSLASNYNPEVGAGAINTDPVFGKTVAITYAQFGLTQNGFSFTGTGPVLDSVVLGLAYSGYYGDSLGQQNFTVYRVTDPGFNDTTVYYMHQQLAIDRSNPVGKATASPHDVRDSIHILGAIEAPQLRIRLNNLFGSGLMQQKADGAFTNDSTFHSWLRGLAIVPDSVTGGTNSIIYLDLSSAYSGITVYYHNSTDDSLQAYFPFNINTCGFANYMHRDYTGSKAARHFGDTTSLEGDSLIFLQSNPGLYTNIEIPSLDDFPNVIINKAELIMTQVPDPDHGIFTSPDRLFLWKYKNAGQDSLGYIFDVGAVSDPVYGVQLSNLSYFGGAKKTITNSDGIQVAQYRINITRYLQHLITKNPAYGETNFGFRLVVLDASSTTRDAGRVILGGGSNSKYALKLHLIYTKIK